MKAWNELAADGASRQSTLSRDIGYRNTLACAFGAQPTFAVPKDASGHATKAHRTEQGGVGQGELGDEWIVKFDNGRVISVGWSYDDPDPSVKAGRWSVTGVDKADVATIKAAVKGCVSAGVGKAAKATTRSAKAPAARGYRGSFDVVVTMRGAYEPYEGGPPNPKTLASSIEGSVNYMLGSISFSREVLYEQLGDAEFPPEGRVPIDFTSLKVAHTGALSFKVSAKVKADIAADRTLTAAQVAKAIKKALEIHMEGVNEDAEDNLSLRGDLHFPTVRVTVKPAGQAKRKVPARKKAAKRKPAGKKRAKKPAARKKGTVRARAKRPGR